MLDDDAMYIELARAKEHFTELPDEAPIQSEAVMMVRELQKSDDALLSQIKSYKFNVVGRDGDSEDGNTDSEHTHDSEYDDNVTESDLEEEEGEDDDDEEEDETEDQFNDRRKGHQKNKNIAGR